MSQRKHKRRTDVEVPQEMSPFNKIASVFLFLVFITASYLVLSFTPMSKEEQIKKFSKVDENVEPFRKNLTECARQTKATMVDIEHFLKRIPQSTTQGKCFVACILKRNAIITNNKVNRNNLLEANRAVYGDDSEVMNRLKSAIKECNKAVDGIFDICEYATVFNDCMHMKMEHILDKVTMERRMEALGQMTSDPDEWTDEDDEILKMVKDEL